MKPYKRYGYYKIFLKLVKQGVLTVEKSGRITNTETGKVWFRGKKRGYVGVRLTLNGRRIRIVAHALIWIVFNGPIPEGYEINHKDGLKWNNKLSNLEMVTHLENIQHAAETGLITRGEERHSSKLLESEVLEIRRRFKNGESIASLSKEYAVVKGTVGALILGNNWSHVPGFLTKDAYKAIKSKYKHRHIDEETVIKIRKTFKKGKYTLKALVEKFNLDQGTLRSVLLGNTYKDLPHWVSEESYRNILINKGGVSNLAINEKTYHKIIKLGDSYSQRDLSAKIGVSRSIVQRVLAGKFDKYFT